MQFRLQLETDLARATPKRMPAAILCRICIVTIRHRQLVVLLRGAIRPDRIVTIIASGRLVRGGRDWQHETAT
jgi:hypothetical protein